MIKRILVDAAHEEEIRLVLAEDEVIRAFDYSNRDRGSIKGNIYLVKVTRVEPSLQAAFVEYGGKKQGFLPLAEIHPDYYQIPKDDKDALIDLMMKAKQETEELGSDADSKVDSELAQISIPESDDSNGVKNEEETLVNRPPFYKKYRIQEVIKKDQVLLAQITKEERGTKGASLSTYISLAGRYCVLLPNAGNAGGLSRKIDDPEERKRLKSVIKELSENLESANSVIMRTAGAYKTKAEIKRDLSYLSRLWNNIREHTLSSIAPTFIHEEGDIIKKAIRDVYDSDVEEIIISGSKAYEDAKTFIKLLLPRHVDKVKLHEDTISIFSKYGIEEQLRKLYDSTVQLSSGGYIVINQTEALVAIDVNSGRSTGEKNIENTALKNNLEAAKEIAKQLKLRDLSGLVVIDFIDMGESKNRKEVERVLRENLSYDKARIQVGKISEFGLLEMSRQRLRQSFVENYMLTCAHCAGKGKIRPENFTAIAIIRAIENEIATGSYNEIRVLSSKELILYFLNQKCSKILDIEKIHGVKINFSIDEEAGADGFFLEGIKRQVDSKKAALSAIDFEPYRIEPIEKEPVKKQSESKKQEELLDSNKDLDESGGEEEGENSSNKPNPRRNFKKHVAVKSDMDPEKTDDYKANKNTKHRRKFRKPQVNRVDSPSGVNNDEGVVKDDLPADGGKNHSLLREIWKKIVD